MGLIDLAPLLLLSMLAAPPASPHAEAKDGASSRLEIRMPVRIARVGADLRAVVRVANHADNRLLRVTLDSDLFFRSTEIELEGADAIRNHLLTWKDLPLGDYVVEATLLGSAGQRARAAVPLAVK